MTSEKVRTTTTIEEKKMLIGRARPWRRRFEIVIPSLREREGREVRGRRLLGGGDVDVVDDDSISPIHASNNWLPRLIERR
jgi:hypothetical protein